MFRYAPPPPPLPDAAPDAAPGSLAGRALLHVACETLALGCLFERRQGLHIRVPVQRRQQAAGCEWHGRRVGGALARLSYTFDPAEGWAALWRDSPERVAALYRRILGRPDIAAAELGWRSDMYVRASGEHVLAFPAGSYNPFNAWNTARGAVHLNGPVGEGFEGAGARLPGPPVIAPLDVPRQGLLFLGDRDRTAEVLRIVRLDGARGPVRRIEVAAPAEASWSLDDMTLPDGEGFTPLGLFRALRGAAEERDADAAWPANWPEGAPCLPGGMVAEALLRRARLGPTRLASTRLAPTRRWPGPDLTRKGRGPI